MSDPVLTKVAPLIQRQVQRLETSNALSDSAVHDLRVLTKRLRAALRLYRDVAKKPDLREVDHLIRNTASAFAASRDSHVQLKTLKRLLKQYPDLVPASESVMTVLLDSHREVEKPDRREAAEMLRQALALWQECLAQADGGFVYPGLEYTYQKAGQLGDKALQGDRDEPYHQWRKWCKYWLYQQELMFKTQGSSQQIYRERLTDLGTDLGKFHDFCLLEKSLLENRENFAEPEKIQLILQRIAAVKRSYRRSFAADYAPLFRLEPGLLIPQQSAQS